ncbi:MAG: type II secretion system F family protein [Candidatus Nanohalobium sp.]
MIKKYADFCYDQVGPYALEVLDSFEGLRPQLNRAGFDVSLPEYVSMMLFSSLLSGVGTAVFLSLLFIPSSGFSGVILGISAGVVAAGAALVIFYLLPSIRISDRASKIDDDLPFAVMYLSTLAGTGTSITEMFKNLAESEEYDEIAEEAEKVHRDIESFGLDVPEALTRAAERSPSDDLEDVMWGLNHTLTTGGSVRDFLDQRAESLMKDYQRRVDEFSEQLSLIVEMYIILVIVGSIIFISMSVIVSAFGGINPEMVIMIQAISVFVGLPFLSGGLIIMIDGISPGGID